MTSIQVQEQAVPWTCPQVKEYIHIYVYIYISKSESSARVWKFGEEETEAAAPGMPAEPIRPPPPTGRASGLNCWGWAAKSLRHLGQQLPGAQAPKAGTPPLLCQACLQGSEEELTSLVAVPARAAHLGLVCSLGSSWCCPSAQLLIAAASLARFSSPTFLPISALLLARIPGRWHRCWQARSSHRGGSGLSPSTWTVTFCK